MQDTVCTWGQIESGIQCIGLHPNLEKELRIYFEVKAHVGHGCMVRGRAAKGSLVSLADV